MEILRRKRWRELKWKWMRQGSEKQKRDAEERQEGLTLPCNKRAETESESAEGRRGEGERRET